ncbi:MAG: hypothetical protein ACLUVC_15505, partial [Longibaculum sp.]
RFCVFRNYIDLFIRYSPFLLAFLCQSMNVSSHLQIKYVTIPATTETKNEMTISYIIVFISFQGGMTDSRIIT